MTAYTVKCSLSGAKTVEAVKAHLKETQSDFEKRYSDWTLKNEVDLGLQKINTARIIISPLISEACHIEGNLNVQVRNLIDGPIGQSGRHIVRKKREEKNESKHMRRKQKEIENLPQIDTRHNKSIIKYDLKNDES